jgi:putative DNA methylase
MDDLKQRSENHQPKGWHDRGYLPHFDGGEICQFVTIHLGDSMPVSVWRRWKLQLEAEKDEVAKVLLYDRFEKYLDEGYGECFLKRPKIAEIVEESLIHFDGERYKLRAWVIMPNHLHFMITPMPSFELSDIIQKLKSFTSHKANKLLNRQGKFWQEDYFDRYIRDFEHYENTIAYIKNNPVKARLCRQASDWRFGSARFLNNSTQKLESP